MNYKLIFFLICLSVLRLYEASGAPGVHHTRKSGIVIDNFVMISGDPDFVDFGSKIPVIIDLCFSPRSNYNTFLLNELDSTAKNSRNKNRILDTAVYETKKIFNEKGIIYMISGNYTQLDNKINCNIRLTDLSTGSFVKSSTGFSDYSIILQQIQESVESLMDDIKILEVKRGGIKTTALVFKYSGKDSLVESYKEALYYSIYSNFRKNNKIIISPYDSTLIYGNKSFSTLMEEKQLDFLMVCNYQIKKDSIFILPSLKFSAIEKEIGLNKLKDSTIEFSYMIDEFTSQISNSIAACIDSNGSWKMDIIQKECSDYQACLEEAKKYFNTSNLPAALFFVSKAIGFNPESSEGYYLKGKIEEQGKYFMNAIDSYEMSITYDSTNPEKYVQLGNLYVKEGMYKRAIGNFMEAKKLNYPGADFQIGKTQYLVNEDEFRTATKTLKIALAKGHNKDQNAEASIILGDIYKYRNNIDSAKMYYENALKIIPESKNAKIGLNNLYIQQGKEKNKKGDFKNALVSFQKANSVFRNYESMFYLYRTYNRLFQFEKSDSIIRLGIKENIFIANTIFIDHARDLMNIQNKELTTVTRKKAIAYLEQLHDLQSTKDINSSIRLLGLAYFELNDFKNAAKYYKKVLASEPLNIINYLNIAELYVMLQEPANALEVLTKADGLGNVAEYNRIIKHYLHCAALKEAGKDPSAEHKKLTALLKDKVSLNWSFETFKNWLEGPSVNKDLKKYLKALTKETESKAL